MTEEPQRLELTVLSQIPEVIPTLAGWFADEWPEYFEKHEAVAHFEAQARHAESLPIALVVVANDEPIGTVAIKADSIDGATELGPWLAGLYVHLDYRERGIGSLLVTCATRVAWQLGHEKVYVGTHQLELMRALGWTPVRESVQRGQAITIFEYEKPEAPPSYYERIGGEAKVRALVDRFYDLMDELPEATEVREMHAKSLKASRQKLFEFLSGWMGGPSLYVERRGHPRLRMRHMPFSIGTKARDQWLMCMDQALDEVVDDEATREELRDSFVRIADHMRNRRGP